MDLVNSYLATDLHLPNLDPKSVSHINCLLSDISVVKQKIVLPDSSDSHENVVIYREVFWSKINGKHRFLLSSRMPGAKVV